MDARTGRPPAGIASVTVVGDSLTAVDIDATAAFALGDAGRHWLASRGHHAVLVVHADGSITSATGVLGGVVLKLPPRDCLDDQVRR